MVDIRSLLPQIDPNIGFQQGGNASIPASNAGEVINQGISAIANPLIEKSQKLQQQKEEQAKIRLLRDTDNMRRELTTMQIGVQQEVGEGAKDYTNRYMKMADDYINTATSRYSEAERTFLQPHISSLKSQLHDDAYNYEMKEGASFTVNNLKQIIEGNLEQVGTSEISYDEKLNASLSIIDDMTTIPFEVKRQLKDEVKETYQERFLDNQIQEDPQAVVDKYTQPDMQTEAPSSPVSFDNLVEHTFKKEGGYVADDAGAGPTLYGINSSANPALYKEMKALWDDGKKEEARQMGKEGYRSFYWDAINADTLPNDMKELAFESAVNQGVPFTNEALKQANGDAQKFYELRKERYHLTAERFPEKRKNLGAWLERLDKIKYKSAPASSKSRLLPPEVMAKIEKAKSKIDEEQQKYNKEVISEFKGLAYSGNFNRKDLDALHEAKKISTEVYNAVIPTIDRVENKALKAEKEVISEFKGLAYSGNFNRKDLDALHEAKKISTEVYNAVIPTIDRVENKALKAEKEVVKRQIEQDKKVRTFYEERIMLGKTSSSELTILHEKGMISAENYVYLYPKAISQEKTQKQELKTLNDFKSGIAGTQDHTKAVNSIASKEEIKNAFFSPELPVQDRIANVLSFISQAKNVVPNDLIKVMSQMKNSGGVSQGEYVGGIVSGLKAFEDKSALRSLPKEVREFGELYNMNRQGGALPAEASRLAHESTNPDNAKIQILTKKFNDEFKDKDLLKTYGDREGFFDDILSDSRDFADQDSRDPAYYEMQGEFVRNMRDHYIRTQDTDLSAQLAGEALSKVWARSFNGRFMKYAPETVTGLSSFDIEEDFNAQMMPLLKQDDVASIISDPITESQVKQGLPISYLVMKNEYEPLKDKRGNVVRYRVNVDDIKKSKIEEASREVNQEAFIQNNPQEPSMFLEGAK